jgi:L-lactate dehydrogenase complex protein LldG
MSPLCAEVLSGNVAEKRKMMPNSPQPDARSAIFASIRENLAASAPFDKARHEHFGPAVPGSAPSGPSDLPDLLGEFRQSLEMVGAKCVLVDNENAAAGQLHEIVRELSAQQIAISDSELIRRLIKVAKLAATQDASRGELFSADIGITSAQFAIAETGTLVLESGAESHRLVSLVPPVHVCVLTGARSGKLWLRSWNWQIPRPTEPSHLLPVHLELRILS